MKIAAVQMQMKYEVADNLSNILCYLDAAARQGAALVIFPELTITGCHRKIVEGVDLIRASDDWLDQIKSGCRQSGIAAFVGVPTFDGDQVFDSYILIDDMGDVIDVSHKIGLTPAEQTYFSPGCERRVVDYKRLRLGVVICREIADLADLQRDFTDVDVLLWPCFSAVYDTLPETEEQMTHQQASRVSKTLGASMLQSNWSHSLNSPDMTNTGGSVFVSKSGQKLAMAPLAEAGFAIADVADNSFEWHDQVGDA